MMHETETNHQANSRNDTAVSPHAGSVPQPSRDVNPQSTNKAKKTRGAPRPAEIVIFLSVILAFVVLLSWKTCRAFLDYHAGSLTAIATIAIVILTAFYVIYARSQWEVMEGQLAEMASSGQQSKDMLAKVETQIAHLKSLAAASTKSANALAHSERAWLFPEFKPADPSNLAYNLIVTNFGRTLGEITAIKVGFDCIAPHVKPKEPFNFGLPFVQQNYLILPSEPIIVKKFILTDYFADQWVEVGLGTKQAIVFASIEYRDMMGESHNSFACYSWRLPSHELEDNRPCRRYE